MAANRKMAENGEICSGDQGSCLPDFLENHPEFQYVQVPDDGDCFFHSIAAYYARTGERIDGISDPTDPYELRQYVVGKFIEIVNTNANVRNTLLHNDRNSIANLFESGVWATTSFDVMITMVPRILHINLHIYGVNHYNDGQFIITRATYEEDARTTITLFLASNHYGLLYPIDGINRRSSAKKRANAKVIANIERQRKENAEATAKLLAKYEKQASKPKRTTTRKKKAEPLHENENMRRAMELSLQNLRNAAFNNNIANQIQRIQQINNNAKLAAKLAALELSESPKQSRGKPRVGKLPVANNATKKRKPRVGVLPPSSQYEISNAEVEASMSQIVPQNSSRDDLKKILDQYNISYNPRATQPTLYKLLFNHFKRDIIRRTIESLSKK